jgi:hypothetical protein
VVAVVSAVTPPASVNVPTTVSVVEPPAFAATLSVPVVPDPVTVKKVVVCDGIPVPDTRYTAPTGNAGEIAVTDIDELVVVAVTAAVPVSTSVVEPLAVAATLNVPVDPVPVTVRVAFAGIPVPNTEYTAPTGSTGEIPVTAVDVLAVVAATGEVAGVGLTDPTVAPIGTYPGRNTVLPTSLGSTAPSATTLDPATS